MKWRIYKEAVEEVNFKKLLRQNGVTKLPSGMQEKYGKLEWHKYGGYAGEKTIRNMCIQLEQAGWKRGGWKSGGKPDGSVVGNSEDYVSPDGKVAMSYYESFGVTSHDNSYYITFKLTGGQVNEADGESDDDFTRSNRPQIYRYYEDNETPIEEFVKHVHSAEQEIEDIFIQNSDVYENADDPWELFCDDMHGENETLEESLDLDYYMNNAAYEQLPEDIKQYVYRSSGTCDFDAVQWLRGIFERLMPICKDQYNESSRFGFNVGDEVELTSDVEPNRFSDRGVVPAGTVGEIVAVDKPMRGVIKVKIEDGSVVSVPERKLKFAGTDNEPWEKYKTPAKPKPSLKEILDKHGPEEIYMEPPRPGSPKWTGD